MNEFLTALLSLLLVLWGWTAFADGTRPALTLQGSWTVEVASPDPVNGIVWQVEAQGTISGGAFVQIRAFSLTQVKGCIDRRDGTGICKRLRIRTDKPTDKVASFAIQFPGRTERVSAAAGIPYAELVLSELSLEDYGAMAFQLIVEGASTQSFGAIDIRTHDQDIVPAAMAAITVDGKVLHDGDQVKKGWWFLFFGTAKDADVLEDPTDLLSLCGFFPGGKVQCVNGNEMDIRLTERGDYLFIAWNKNLLSSAVTIRGV